MARIIRFHEHGGPEVLRIEEADVPPPGAGQVQIRVKALGLNRAEVMLRTNNYIETPKAWPSGLGYEAAGVVAAVGPGVDSVAVGDAVSVVPAVSQIEWPAYAELANFQQHLVVKHPASLSWEEAAATWMQYVTAHGALIDLARLGKGDVVAITAASSSVGLAAIQIANMVGATPIAVTRTSAKRQALRDAGAAHVVASEEEDLEARLTEIAGPGGGLSGGVRPGVQVVFDPIGGPAFASLTAAMARGGILIEYGALSPEPTPFPLFNVLGKSLTLRGYLVHEVTADPVRLEAAKDFILEGLTSGALKPIIARSFAFDDIVEAHRYLESNQQFGKIVVTL
ncbi:zinc-dependent alcohol dehydrogenase family protein [Azospirillum sp. B4]|uniref:zinc-dependent alcohol dehydrogenase family protein n=1 Tax=Azospirillum sp. B4 TaxID=95605 RepID=UPI0005C7F622|nr:zinc-dependent alcohol dehydrogenase family protein [Azospirillum sp. B4]